MLSLAAYLFVGGIAFAQADEDGTTRAAASATGKTKPKVVGSPKTGGRDAMVLIPAGESQMGSPYDVGGSDEHPRHKVYLDAYRMDKDKVTAG